MQLIPIMGNSQKLDGGAMFGHVPRAVWSAWFSPDEKNRITLACRALLIKEKNRNILLETGIGLFFPPHLRERYGVFEGEHVLLESLKQIGLTDKDIDIVILSHLHFDHAGGLLSPYQEGEALKLLFPNAHYIVSQDAWSRAQHPHVRDKASFIPELNELLLASARLVLVSDIHHELLGKDYSFMYTQGHTPGLLHTMIHIPEDHPVIFASDLIPGAHWVHLPITMGYDRAAELIIEEKKAMLELARRENAKLFYTHDPHCAMSLVKVDQSGKYSADLINNTIK